MDTIKEIESIRADILDTIAKCECGDDCESVVFLKKIAARLAAVKDPAPQGDVAMLLNAIKAIKDINDTRQHDGKGYEINDIIEEALSSVATSRPLADAPAAAPTPDGAAPSAPVPSVPSVPSNTAQLRKAVEDSNGLLEELATLGEWHDAAQEQISANKAALAAPARNCEVGTAEEQTERFYSYCKVFSDNDGTCTGCPCCGSPFGRCEFVWAQMPYEAKGGGAK